MSNVPDTQSCLFDRIDNKDCVSGTLDILRHVEEQFCVSRTLVSSREGEEGATQVVVVDFEPSILGL
jgi:hypothetical protein